MGQFTTDNTYCGNPAVPHKNKGQPKISERGLSRRDILIKGLKTAIGIACFSLSAKTLAKPPTYKVPYQLEQIAKEYQVNNPYWLAQFDGMNMEQINWLITPSRIYEPFPLEKPEVILILESKPVIAMGEIYHGNVPPLQAKIHSRIELKKFNSDDVFYSYGWQGGKIVSGGREDKSLVVTEIYRDGHIEKRVVGIMHNDKLITPEAFEKAINSESWLPKSDPRDNQRLPNPLLLVIPLSILGEFIEKYKKQLLLVKPVIKEGIYEPELDCPNCNGKIKFNSFFLKSKYIIDAVSVIPAGTVMIFTTACETCGKQIAMPIEDYQLHDALMSFSSAHALTVPLEEIKKPESPEIKAPTKEEVEKFGKIPNPEPQFYKNPKYHDQIVIHFCSKCRKETKRETVSVKWDNPMYNNKYDEVCDGCAKQAGGFQANLP